MRPQPSRRYARGMRRILLACLAPLACSAPAPPSAAIPAARALPLTCPREQVDTIAGRSVHRLPGGAIGFLAGLHIDADGAPRAYHPDSARGLDRLANAGRPGHWWALVTDTGTASGTPIVQGPEDPAPGFHVSTTSLVDPRHPLRDPRRYVDAATIPYLALPPAAVRAWGVALGDLAAVHDPRTDTTALAIVADIGPADALGEASIALADALALPSDPRLGGVEPPRIAYVLFPGTGDGRPHTAPEIERDGARLLGAWGGDARLRACFPATP
jgi:hypothetical protein